jgi:hypothetical protein
MLPAILGLLLLAVPANAITGTSNPTTLANAGLRDRLGLSLEQSAGSAARRALST